PLRATAYRHRHLLNALVLRRFRRASVSSFSSPFRCAARLGPRHAAIRLATAVPPGRARARSVAWPRQPRRTHAGRPGQHIAASGIRHQASVVQPPATDAGRAKSTRRQSRPPPSAHCTQLHPGDFNESELRYVGEVDGVNDLAILALRGGEPWAWAHGARDEP